jgi:hypothetical protein
MRGVENGVSKWSLFFIENGRADKSPPKMQGGSRLDTAADVLVGSSGMSKKESRPINSRRQKSKAAWDPSWPAQPDHAGSDGEEARSDASESDSEDLVGEARLDRLAAELKELPVSNLYPEIAAAGLEVSLLDQCILIHI